MQKDEKQRLVTELTERLQSSETLIVADYRGLTMPQIDDLRTELLKHGAKFTVVKNTLTRRAAEAAGADTLLALLEGPTAIAFLEADGDPVAVAKAIGAAARETTACSRSAEACSRAGRSRPLTSRTLRSCRRSTAPRPGARRDHRPALRDRRPVQRPAAEPGRADRRSHRAARSERRRGGAGRGGRSRSGTRGPAEEAPAATENENENDESTETQETEE